MSQKSEEAWAPDRVNSNPRTVPLGSSTGRSARVYVRPTSEPPSAVPDEEGATATRKIAKPSTANASSLAADVQSVFQRICV